MIKRNYEICYNEKVDLIKLVNKEYGMGVLDLDKLNIIMEEDIVSVLVDNGTIIGVIIVRRILDYSSLLSDSLLDNLNANCFPETDFIYTIDKLVIDEEYRDNGYGKFLVDSVVNSLDGDILRFVWLNPTIELKLSSFLGTDFIKIGEITDYWYDKILDCCYCVHKCRCPAVVSIKV